MSSSSSSSYSPPLGPGTSSKPKHTSSYFERKLSYSLPNKHHPDISLMKGIAILLMLIVLGYSLLWIASMDSAKRLEDHVCPLKEWDYPTCLPRAGEILQHIPTPEEWVQYRAAYQKAALTPGHFSLETTEWTNGSATGFAVPVRVEYTKERGRGVYADAFIPKGSKIWDNRYTARLFNECEGKRFIKELTNDQACNVIVWGYTTDHGTGQLEWGVDLDPCSFTNEAKTPDEVNVVDRVVNPAKALEPGGHSMWASRHIEEGEELLSSYEGIRDINPKKNLWWQVKGVFIAWGLRSFIF